jgi:phosphate starvation-inducible membrane PsiE
MQSSPVSRHFLLLGPNILLSILFSNTLNLCSSLSVRDQVSHPYKTTGKIMILYILILSF